MIKWIMVGGYLAEQVEVVQYVSVDLHHDELLGDICLSNLKDLLFLLSCFDYQNYLLP